MMTPKRENQQQFYNSKELEVLGKHNSRYEDSKK